MGLEPGYFFFHPEVKSLMATNPSNLSGSQLFPYITFNLGRRLIVFSGRSTLSTRRDLIVLMSLPLLLPLEAKQRTRRSVKETPSKCLHKTSDMLQNVKKKKKKKDLTSDMKPASLVGCLTMWFHGH